MHLHSVLLEKSFRDGVTADHEMRVRCDEASNDEVGGKKIFPKPS